MWPPESIRDVDPHLEVKHRILNDTYSGTNLRGKQRKPCPVNLLIRPANQSG
jgi:hypothetical protein